MTAAVRSDRRAFAGAAAAGRPVRVLHLLPDLRIGGGQAVVLQHLQHADRARFDVRVAALAATGPLLDAVEAASGAPVLAVGSRRAADGPAAAARLARALRRERIDVLHVHSDADRKVGQLAALLARVPVVGHLHAEWVHLGPMHQADPSRADRVRARLTGALRDGVERRTVRRYVATSARVADLFAPLVGPPIAIVPPTVSPERFAPDPARRATVRAELGIPTGAPVLVSVARLAEGKGADVLLEVLAGVLAVAPDAVLVLVGDGPMRADLEARARHLGIHHAVRFLGERLDVPDVLRAADVFAFASANEGFGIAVLEAMAAALPVGAMRCAALDDLVVDGLTGHLVPQGDVAGMVAALSRLLADGEARRAAGSAGRDLAAARFRPAAVAERLEAVYLDVLAARRGGAA